MGIRLKQLKSFYGSKEIIQEIENEAKRHGMHFNEYLIYCHKKTIKENEAKEYFKNRNKGEWRCYLKKSK